nr:unnamed protein product [Callosobruchus analis]
MEANALESVSRQMEDFDGRKGSVEVNKILHKNIPNRNAPSTASSSRSCYRCNAKSHLSCPDKDSTCQKCGMKGHTSYHCRSKFMKRKPRYHSPPKQSKRTGSKRQHRDESDEDNDILQTSLSSKLMLNLYSSHKIGLHTYIASASTSAIASTKRGSVGSVGSVGNTGPKKEERRQWRRKLATRVLDIKSMLTRLEQLAKEAQAHVKSVPNIKTEIKRSINAMAHQIYGISRKFSEWNTYPSAPKAPKGPLTQSISVGVQTDAIDTGERNDADLLKEVKDKLDVDKMSINQ